MLAPTLRPDDIVLLDNLSSHKAAGDAEAITAQGAQPVYLPPYSPDLNPIEQAIAKFKAALRHAPERTRERLWQAIGRTLDRYQPPECRNFFKKAGDPIRSKIPLARIGDRRRTAAIAQYVFSEDWIIFAQVPILFSRKNERPRGNRGVNRGCA